jgi:hypothetical protein
LTLTAGLEAAREAGAQTTLSKPFDIDRIVDLLFTHLNEGRKAPG